MSRQDRPKDERVRTRSEFTRILGEGQRLPGRFVTAFWLAGEAGAPSVNRVGVAAGKRLGNAVVRNLLKRRLREAYRRNKWVLPCRGISVILVAKRRMIGRSSEEVAADVTALLRDVASCSKSPSSSSD
jgi:ribonuclease P protein component